MHTPSAQVLTTPLVYWVTIAWDSQVSEHGILGSTYRIIRGILAVCYELAIRGRREIISKEGAQNGAETLCLHGCDNAEGGESDEKEWEGLKGGFHSGSDVAAAKVWTSRLLEVKKALEKVGIASVGNGTFEGYCISV
jgi:hypothetical protein